MSAGNKSLLCWYVRSKKAFSLLAIAAGVAKLSLASLTLGFLALPRYSLTHAGVWFQALLAARAERKTATAVVGVMLMEYDGMLRKKSSRNIGLHQKKRPKVTRQKAACVCVSKH